MDRAVVSQLSVFRKAQTSNDALPQSYRQTLHASFPHAAPNVAAARRVVASDGQAAYLVPANGGVCVINANESFCTQVTDLPGSDAVDLCSPTLPKGQIEMEWLLPDGAHNVAVGMTNGATSTFGAGFNVYIARFPISGPIPSTITWDVGGNHHSISAGVPADVHSQTCAHPEDLPPASQLPRSAAPEIVGP